MPDSLRQFKAEIFQALAHPTRIAVLDLLREGALTVNSFAERLNLEQANLSQHLAVLRARQIVVTRKAGNQVFLFGARSVDLEDAGPDETVLPEAGGRVNGAAGKRSQGRGTSIVSFPEEWVPRSTTALRDYSARQDRAICSL